MNNFEMMGHRLEYYGGIHQEDRMIKDKYKSFKKSLMYSYQTASVSLVQKFSETLAAAPYGAEKQGESIEQATRALINPDKVKQDYDDKILSIDYACGIGLGDVIEWRGTNTYWIVYLEQITEDAYFRGEIRRCKYKIKFKDDEGNWLETWAAIRGPVETQIDSIQKNQIRIDRPNLSLNILMPRNEKTLAAFERYKEFLFAGHCWQVKAPDSISMTNVIEIAAEEYYINKDTDDIEYEMKNGLVVEPIDPTPLSDIKGETFIKPKITETYIVKREDIGKWSVENGVPVQIRPNGNTVQVIWMKSTHGQFNLTWTKDNETLTKTIVVESLF